MRWPPYLTRIGGSSLLLLLVAAVLVSLWTFSPNDPAVGWSYPTSVSNGNWLGAPGAIVAMELKLLFGLALYPLLLLLVITALAGIFYQSKQRWVAKIFGAQLLFLCVALLTHLIDWPVRFSPQTSAGGSFGKALSELFSSWIGQGLVWLFAFFGSILSLVLLTGNLWMKLFPALYDALADAFSFLWKPMQSLALRTTQALPMKINLFTKAEDASPDIIPIHHPSSPEVEKVVVSSTSKAEPPVVSPTVSEPKISTPRFSFNITPQQQTINSSAGESFANDYPEYEMPRWDILEDPEVFPYAEHEQKLREKAVKLEQVFADFGLTVKVVGINTGPVITQFEVALETGLRLSRVTSLADDLALKLKADSVRVVAPLPGKDTVGIEVPNDRRAVVKMKELLQTAGNKLNKAKIPLLLGRDSVGDPLVFDLADMPHLLIAGRTGTGKSVCMNTIILSILMTRRPDQVRMIMIDPKMLELSEYGKVPHLMCPVVKDMKKSEAVLAWACEKMDERYEILTRAKVRSLAAYNELSPEEIYRRVKPADDEEKARIPERMPYIVIFIDEMNDLMMLMRKEVEGHIIRLSTKSRAAGIHLVVATQKPTVDVITGLIKSNLPARICFKVSSRVDSRVVLDEMGAEKLLGKGDMLFLQSGTNSVIRAQGTYASDKDIANVVEYLETDQPVYARDLIQVSTSRKSKTESGGNDLIDILKERDPLYPEAVEVVIREQRGSVSLIQRALGIGYGKAARFIDFMAEDGFVGPYNGANARDVLLKQEQWEDMKAGRMPEESPLSGVA